MRRRVRSEKWLVFKMTRTIYGRVGTHFLRLGGCPDRCRTVFRRQTLDDDRLRVSCVVRLQKLTAGRGARATTSAAKMGKNGFVPWQRAREMKEIPVVQKRPAPSSSAASLWWLVKGKRQPTNPLVGSSFSSALIASLKLHLTSFSSRCVPLLSPLCGCQTF